MRILFLPRYGPQGASSRYRIWQYVPLFERAGHEVEVQPLVDDLNALLDHRDQAIRRARRFIAPAVA